VVANLDYDNGTNPSNIDFVTGLGWRREREIVSQFARNDDRVLPPSGLPLGSIRQVEPYLATYGTVLRTVVWPPDDDRRDPYPIYDRWSDSWNVQAECVTAQQSRCLVAAAWLMAASPRARQPWRAAPMRIVGVPLGGSDIGHPVTARLQCDGMDLSGAVRIVWERSGAEPVFGGPTLRFTPEKDGWVEAEAQWGDGRRAFAHFDY
jgi:hypothetical protein